MEGHVAAQLRTANPFMNKLRDIALCVKRLNMLGEGLRASSIIELAEDNQIKIEGDTEEKKQMYFGIPMGLEGDLWLRLLPCWPLSPSAERDTVNLDKKKANLLEVG